MIKMIKFVKEDQGMETTQYKSFVEIKKQFGKQNCFQNGDVLIVINSKDFATDAQIILQYKRGRTKKQ